MHKFEKSPPDLVDRFRRWAAEVPDAQPGQMFGYPNLFANGHLVTGLMGSDWMVRLPEERRAVLLAEPGAHVLEPMPGRPMKEYVVFPRAWIDSPERMQPWIDEALAYVRAMPPKEPKARKKRG
jgi:hypothetical protein